MLKKLLKLLQKMIISSFALYSYNVIAAPLNLIVPINIITVSLVTFLGIPALLGFIIILLFVY